MHPDAVRILAELPINLPEQIRKKIRRGENLGYDTDLDKIAEEIVERLNDGQRWVIACRFVRGELDNQYRNIVRTREHAATTRTAAGRRAAETTRLREAQRTRDIQDLGLPSETTTLELVGIKMGLAMKECEHQMRLDLTEELLGSSFAVGNGHRVTWADATTEEHALRAEMLERQGVGTLHTAVLHRTAIRDIESSGAGSLGEIAARNAA